MPTKIGFSIELHIMGHAEIERVPEAFYSSRLGGWHTEMVAVASEVGLAGHAYGCGVSAGSTVITIGFVVARSHHFVKC